jgi:D-alanyl-D-alanine carboxypeptidase
MYRIWHARRPFSHVDPAHCPDPPQPADMARAAPGESYGGKAIELRRDALGAYQRMRAAARAEDPAIARDPRALAIFSGFRDPTADLARCAADGACDNRRRTWCSAHRTGTAADMYLGAAPGFGPDSTAPESRLYLSRTPAYRWLVANAGRFGFVNYVYEPWHWEWAGDPATPPIY